MFSSVRSLLIYLSLHLSWASNPLEEDYDFIDINVQDDILARLRDDNVTISFWFVAFGDNFSVQAWRQSPLSVSSQLSLTIHSDNHTQVLSDFPEIPFVTGHLVDRQGRSDIWGHISRDVIFIGIIYTDTELYNIQPSRKYSSNATKKAIIFKNTNFQTERFADDSVKLLEVPNLAILDALHLNQRNEDRQGLKDKKCGVQLVSSYPFFKANGEEIADVLAAMVTPLMFADVIFNKIDFDDDGEPDNVGFMLESFIIYTDSLSDLYFGNDSRDNSTAALEKCGRILQKKCMQVCFLHTFFEDHVLGVSYIAKVNITYKNYMIPGGICFPPIWYKDGYFSSNVAVVTSKLLHQEKWNYPFMGLTMAHEMGHAFGSEHDPSSGPCFPGGVQGNYLMAPDSTLGKKINNRFFSPCSLRSIRAVVAQRQNCLKPQPRWLCGNGIVDPEEECDCGNEQTCLAIDRCCTPKGRLGACTVRRDHGFVCSPKKYRCCNESCQVRPAHPPTLCHSGDIYCTLATFCDGENFTCPGRGIVDDGKACFNYTKTCLNGKCTSNICADYNMKECTCSSFSEQCHVCCLMNGTLCVSAERLGLRDFQIFVKTFEPCPFSYGQCTNGTCIKESFLSRFLDSLLEKKEIITFFFFSVLILMVIVSAVKIIRTKYRLNFKNPDSPLLL